MSRMSAKYYREYRAKNRERILAQERERRAKESPERREHRLALKRANAHKHYKSKRKMPKLSGNALKAHRYAYRRNWLDANREKVREYDRAYRLAHPKPKTARPPKVKQTPEEVRAKRRERYYRWRENNYQSALKYEREHHKKYRTRKGEFKPLLSRRIPDWVECPAHARHLRLRAEQYKRERIISVAMALQSGLSIHGRIRNG